MRCPVPELLTAYLMDEVSGDAKQGLAEHFASCGPCKGELSRLERAHALLAELKPVEPSSDLRRRVLSAAAEAEPTWTRKLFLPRFYLPVGVAAAAMLALMVFTKRADQDVVARASELEVASRLELLSDLELFASLDPSNGLEPGDADVVAHLDELSE